MLYKFKSKASGDVIMVGPNGEQLLRVLGREPAAQGIIETAAMPAAIAALQAAVAEEERRREGAGAQASPAGPAGPAAGDGVSLRQRVWPMLEMLQRAHAAGEPVVWGA